ncbi:hypothetical protein MTX80_13190 [Gordonia amicalis]|nr:hypothetical protein [Gordonia amicalis]UOG20182.1 hypothetical protein MTX80_13190 [Gordonia amicalis]
MSGFPFDVIARWTRRWNTHEWHGRSPVPQSLSSAVAAIERDLGCWVSKKPLPDFSGYEWDILVVGEFGLAHVQLRRWDESGWGGYLRTENPLDRDLPTAQATAFLADELQGDLTGNAWIDWPSAGWDILHATVVDGTAVWVRTRDPHHPLARIGHLCTDRRTSWGPADGSPGGE